MDGWMGWDISCNAGTALHSRFSPPVNEICQVSSRFQFPAEQSVWPFAVALPSLPFLFAVYSCPGGTAGWMPPSLSLFSLFPSFFIVTPVSCLFNNSWLWALAVALSIRRVQHHTIPRITLNFCLGSSFPGRQVSFDGVEVR